jgi:hypothetical protein
MAHQMRSIYTKELVMHLQIHQAIITLRRKLKTPGKRHCHFLRSIQAHNQSYESKPKAIVDLPNGKIFLLLLLFAYEVENVRIVEIFLNDIVRSSTLGKNNLLAIAFQTSFYNWV